MSHLLLNYSVPIVKTQALGRAFRPIFQRLSCTRQEFAEKSGLQPATVGAMLSLKSIKEASFLKVLQHPDLTPDEIASLQEAYLIMVRERLNIADHVIYIYRASGDLGTPIRDLVGDPEIVTAMREISILAKNDESVRNMVMALGELIKAQQEFVGKHSDCELTRKTEELD